ncbi:PIN domain-containing protein [Uniformispora flossi]|uniref:PIN domain-containing protein n=1 Tax=Uniformispora flossi TaxID=3390723 RepID=UPI003C2D3AF5
MGRRLILDTCVLVALQRGQVAPTTVLTADDDVVIAAITAAELHTGVLLAPDDRRARLELAVKNLLAPIPVEDYSAATAEQHAVLLAHTRRSGRPRGAHDLIIAATALATGRTLVTTDAAAKFDELPGVASVTLPIARRPGGGSPR